MGDGYEKVRAGKGGENVLLPRESKEFKRERERALILKGRGARDGESSGHQKPQKKKIEL